MSAAQVSGVSGEVGSEMHVSPFKVGALASMLLLFGLERAALEVLFPAVGVSMVAMALQPAAMKLYRGFTRYMESRADQQARSRKGELRGGVVCVESGDLRKFAAAQRTRRPFASASPLLRDINDRRCSRHPRACRLCPRAPDWYDWEKDGQWGQWFEAKWSAREREHRRKEDEHERQHDYRHSHSSSQSRAGDSDSLYAVLGLQGQEAVATTDDIKRAFRRLALQVSAAAGGSWAWLCTAAAHPLASCPTVC